MALGAIPVISDVRLEELTLGTQVHCADCLRVHGARDVIPTIAAGSGARSDRGFPARGIDVGQS